MSDKNLFTPIIKVFDKIILGINDDEEPKQTEKRRQFIEIDTEEEFDVERSIN